MNGLIRWQGPGTVAWPDFSGLTDLHDEIDRLFGSPLSELVHTSRLLSGWTPALDLYEDKDNFYVKAELPGMKKGGNRPFPTRRQPEHLRRTQAGDQG